jgi:hypothetical protein
VSLCSLIYIPRFGAESGEQKHQPGALPLTHAGHGILTRQHVLTCFHVGRAARDAAQPAESKTNASAALTAMLTAHRLRWPFLRGSSPLERTLRSQKMPKRHCDSLWVSGWWSR